MCSSNVCSGRSRKSKGPETDSSASVVLAYLKPETQKENISWEQQCSWLPTIPVWIMLPFLSPTLSLPQFSRVAYSKPVLKTDLIYYFLKTCHCSLMRNCDHKGKWWIKVTDLPTENEILAGCSDAGGIARWILGF